MNIIHTVSTMVVVLAFGCTNKQTANNRLPSLHNYPTYLDDCPIPADRYDQKEVKKKADALGMRPVDYLHLVNKQKHTQ